MPRTWLFVLNGAYAALLLGLAAAGVILAISIPDLARTALDLPVSPPAEVPTVPPPPQLDRAIELPADTIRGIDFDGGEVYAFRPT